MPPPRPSSKSFSNPVRGKSRFGGSSSKKQPSRMAEMSTSGNTSNSTSESSFRNRGFSDSRTGQSNLSSNSDAHKPRRKRRPKKKRQQVEFLWPYLKHFCWHYWVSIASAAYNDNCLSSMTFVGFSLHNLYHAFVGLLFDTSKKELFLFQDIYLVFPMSAI